MTGFRMSGNSAPSITDPARPVPWRVMSWWMLATVLGFTLGLAALVRIEQGPALVDWGGWRSALRGLLFGVIAASSQWFVLRRLIPAAGTWILASALGSAAGFALISGNGPPEATFPLATAAVGAVVGLFQWAVLRQQVARAGWWVLVTVTSAALMGSFPVVSLNVVQLSAAPTATTALLALLLGLGCLVAPGAIQGGVLVNLLRR